ncbi:hypothetical protein FNF29_04813 [Cafeteria roenbergensis]|uniref:Uncharacterized protein n=1 Tax=Cafeteria roenbergensis TaxID=33653 RepID=A0A5A8DQ45_CAFRO|nr:hypothetical protein FNF29_04813 [Cafeteria roenbergensis]KAA0167249.1 hypothetical protein FNF28_02899 [Cafeteria roenbergensis]|eukprot:KAA0151122.1 hypothetical protein FNF29_04813 [Cafeteria roenbergensis]
MAAAPAAPGPALHAIRSQPRGQPGTGLIARLARLCKHGARRGIEEHNFWEQRPATPLPAKPTAKAAWLVRSWEAAPQGRSASLRR